MVDMFEIFEVAVPKSGVGEVPAVTPHEFSRYLAQSGHPNRRSPAFARDLVAEHLARWGLTSLVDDGRTVVSELATNAIRHALPHMSGRVLLRLVREPTGALIVVFDPSRNCPGSGSPTCGPRAGSAWQ
ncbi:ATP-binding protein [Allosalinactinospora lopnorensis]|uniref:ATP-binding protein n=1 Tax=Allosalinactinospora lopnorensis TaxID=1352348 RepID=UPI00069622AA|nr:ATP-binding protein [Allosalinactinospora lopnorensis]